VIPEVVGVEVCVFGVVCGVVGVCGVCIFGGFLSFTIFQDGIFTSCGACHTCALFVPAFFCISVVSCGVVVGATGFVCVLLGFSGVCGVCGVISTIL